MQIACCGTTAISACSFNLLACNQDDHSTAFAGYGKTPPLKALQTLAAAAGFANWEEAQLIVEHTLHVLAQFESNAKSLGLGQQTVALIAKKLEATRKANKGLLC